MAPRQSNHNRIIKIFACHHYRKIVTIYHFRAITKNHHNHKIKITLLNFVAIITTIMKSYNLSFPGIQLPPCLLIVHNPQHRSHVSTLQNIDISIALYYISLLSGLGNIDDQNRNPNINNRDHLVGRPTSVGFWDGKDPSKQIQGL